MPGSALRPVDRLPKAPGVTMHWRSLAVWIALAAALALHFSATWWVNQTLSLLDPRATTMDRMQASFTRNIEVGPAPASGLPAPPSPAPAQTSTAAQAAAEAASSTVARLEAARRRAQKEAQARAIQAAQATNGPAGEEAAASLETAAAPPTAPEPAPMAAVEGSTGMAAPPAESAATAVPPQSSASASALAFASTPSAATSASSATGSGSGSAAAAASNRESDRTAAFQWPASTRIRYRLLGNYRGEVNGSAQVTWLREGERYQVHLEVFIGPSFAPLVTRRMSSEGIVTATGLSPRRYEQETRQLLSSPRLATLRFDAQGITLANGNRVPPVADVQDTASQFIQMIYLFTTRPDLREAGRSVEIGLALPNRADRWIYDVGPLVVEQTPMGALEAFHVRPRRAAASGDLSVEIWFAPRLEMMPIRFRIRQDADTYVDLFLEQAPQQANP